MAGGGNLPNNMTSYRAQMLWDNITRGDLSAVHLILENGHVNLEERDQSGCTFLMLASELGHVSIVRELLQAGVDPNAVDNENWNALLCASRQGFLEIVMDLLEKNADIEHADMCGWTSLMWACYKGKDLVVCELLERGANPNVKADHNMNCLSWAAGRGYGEILKMLIDKGAKVNSQDKYGTTPIVWACRKGNADIVDTLLAEGAGADATGINSWTPLLVATKGGYSEIVQALLNQDLHVNATDKDGLTALAIAAKDGHFQIANDLLTKGAYVNVVDRNGDSILIHAVKGGHVEVVRALLKKYVDVDVQGQDGKTALYCAVEKSYVEIVRLLLQSSPDLEICTTKDGDTSLLRAVRTRKEECVRMLLDKGAKVSGSDKRGDTALHIAIRARSKRITELLLRNPRHSRLQYRLNKAGESPYSMDTYYQRGILPQIHGHGNLNATDAENLLGYEIYSSALADILSEPGLMTPLIMGLYAKWGSGKSFLLAKLTSEMASFAHQNSQVELTWSWLIAFLLFLFNCFLGEALWLGFNWHIGLAVGLGLLPFEYGFIGIIIFCAKRYDFACTNYLSAVMGRKQRLLELLMKMLFCLPKKQTESEKQQSNGTFSVRFLFSDCTRLSSVGGENSLAAMIGTLCDAVEKEYGFLISRLYRVFKHNTNKTTTSRFKSICCIPYFLLVLFVVLCIMVGIGLAVGFGVDKNLAVDSAMITLASVVGLALIANLYTWGQSTIALAFSQKRQIQKAARRVDMLKMDGFMQHLKTEVELMSGMVNCMDTFTKDQTRLVVIVDGLDSCEQTKVLQVLDTVKSLFSDEGSPFITILAVDPQIIIKGIEQNLRSSYQDTNVNGFDYLRNIVHLPFYLQSQGIHIQQMEAPPSSHPGESPSKAQRQDSNLTVTGSETRHKPSRGMGSTHHIGGSLSSSLPGMIYASSFDLSTTMAKNDYFSDINPRSMRRLMNIVAVTARLLRAYNIDFKWHRLAAWINLIEQWPYRLSWILYFFEEAEIVDNSTSLNSLYQRIVPSIPATKEQDPLLEIDRNVRKLEASLTSKSGNFPLLNVGDLKKFLPCTINLDPYLRKLIRETQHNLERHQMEMASLGGVFPHVPSTSSMTGNLMRDASSERTGLFQPAPNRFGPLAQNNPLLYGLYGPQSQMPLAAMQHPGFMLPYMQMQQQQQQMHQQQQQQQQQNQQNLFSASAKSDNKPNDLNELSGRRPRNFFANLSKPVILSKCSVEDICNLLSHLTGLGPNNVSNYQNSIRENNISGLVLTMCDTADLQPVINMKFGDWQLFRSAIESLKENELLTSSISDEPGNHAMLASQISSGSRSSSQTDSALLPQRSNSVQSGGGSPGESTKTELQKIRALKMRRNNSIAQQLSYETAIMRTAVAEFVEESEEEEEEEEIVEMQPHVFEGPGSIHDNNQMHSNIPARSPRAFFSMRSMESSINSEYSDGYRSPAIEVQQGSSTFLISEGMSTSQSRFDDHFHSSNQPPTVSDLAGVSVASEDSSKDERKGSLSMKDIMPFVKVLDEPQGSSEFLPLVDNLHVESHQGSSATAVDSQQSHFSQDNEESFSSESHLSGVGPRHQGKRLNISNSNPSLALSGYGVAKGGSSERPPAASLVQQRRKHKAVYSSGGSGYNTSSSDNLSPTHTVKSNASTSVVVADIEGASEGNHLHRRNSLGGGPLHSLTSSIERLARPLMRPFVMSHSYHQDNLNESSPSLSTSSSHSSSTHRPPSLYPQVVESRRGSGLTIIQPPSQKMAHLVDQSKSTVVEMFAMGGPSEGPDPSEQFHDRLAQAFTEDSVDHSQDLSGSRIVSGEEKLASSPNVYVGLSGMSKGDETKM